MTNPEVQLESGAAALTDGVISKIPDAEYYSKPMLSNSGMKDLAISPLRFWYKHVRPGRELDQEESKALKFGKALHCMVEGTFHNSFAEAINPANYEGCLSTVEELRTWLRSKGLTPRGTKKADLIAQVQGVDSNVPILEVIERDHAASNSGKTILDSEVYSRVVGATESLAAEPKFVDLMDDAQSEVAVWAVDEESGTPLKGKLDWLTPTAIVDLKTFTQRRGKSIDQSVVDAIAYEGYFRQAYLYLRLYRQVTKSNRRFIFAFVESEPPHEVRLREMKPTQYGASALWWQKSQIETRHFCHIWSDYFNEFGEQPWRRQQGIEDVLDEELRMVAA